MRLKLRQGVRWGWGDDTRSNNGLDRRNEKASLWWCPETSWPTGPIHQVRWGRWEWKQLWDQEDEGFCVGHLISVRGRQKENSRNIQAYWGDGILEKELFWLLESGENHPLSWQSLMAWLHSMPPSRSQRGKSHSFEISPIRVEIPSSADVALDRWFHASEPLFPRLWHGKK